jgi:hypothetical protein
MVFTRSSATTPCAIAAPAIEAEASEIHRTAVAQGLVFAGDHSQAHHDVVSFNWQRRRRTDREMTAVGVELLMLDATRQIRFAYRYEESLVDVARSVHA